MVYELDANGRQLRVVQFTDYTAEQVRTLYTVAADLRDAWADPEDRAAVIEKLAERGIDFDELAESANQPDADPFDLLCHIAFNAPLRTRRERARRLQAERKDFWKQYGPEARAILEELLEKYAAYGAAQFVMPDVLAVPPISAHGNVMEISGKFGGEDKLLRAVHSFRHYCILSRGQIVNEPLQALLQEHRQLSDTLEKHTLEASRLCSGIRLMVKSFSSTFGNPGFVGIVVAYGTAFLVVWLGLIHCITCGFGLRLIEA